MTVRRVVTGHRDGKSLVVSDDKVGPVEPVLIPSAEFYQLWGGDEAPTFPGDGSMPKWHTYFPPVGGFRFSIVTLPPGVAGDELALADAEDAVADIEAKLPGMIQHMEPDEPGMHTADTIDFEVILSGQMILELDDGAEVLLNPGDTVVQNGTRHRWRNGGEEPARMAIFFYGANRADKRD